MIENREFASASQPAQAGGDGRIELRGLFPGVSTLQVALAAGGFETQLRLDWEHGTNDPWDSREISSLAPWRRLDSLGKLKIDLDLRLPPQAGATEPQRVHLLLTMLDDVVAFAGDALWREGRHEFACDPEGGKDCWVLDSLRIAYSLETGAVGELRFNLANRTHPPMTLRVRGLPGLYASMSGCNTVHFARAGSADGARIAEDLALSVTDSLGVHYTAIDLVGTANRMDVYAYRG
jgi:hypothetical protein